jgi:histidine triad (HIT) family protein
MDDNCIFCKIAQGKIPCYKIYEDEKYLAFLDLKPLSKGHALVISKEHYSNIFEIPESTLSELAIVVKKVSERIKEKFNPDGIFINQNNGEKAGQSIMHFHVHVKPIYEDTCLPLEDATNRNVLPGGDMEEYTKILKMN